MTFPEPLTPQQIAAFFPLSRSPIKPGAFEIGLVLGGTVAAGAYTAGVLDRAAARDAVSDALREGLEKRGLP
jgi:hypothetical protein